MFHRNESIFEDCRARYPSDDCELILVEGESAAHSIAALRNQNNQAIFSLQGKPLNAHRASTDKVMHNKFYKGLSECLGFPMADATVKGAQQEVLFGLDNNFLLAASQQLPWVEKRRYTRVIMLFDPDADGIHIGALMMMFFHRWMRPLIDAGVIQIVRAPMFEITYSDAEGEFHSTTSYSPLQNQKMIDLLKEAGKLQVKAQHFRGLGSINPDMLRSYCLEPSTRTMHTLSNQLAQDAIAVFSA